MPATVGTVSVYAGDTVDWPVYTIKSDPDTARDLAAEGWTDWKAQWRVTDLAVDFIELSVDDSRADEGMILISASPAQTATMGESGVWDLQAVNGDEVKTWLRGKTKWMRDVTRD